MKKWLYWAAGGLAILAFYILGGPGRKVKKLKIQRDDLVLEGSGRAKARAHQKGVQADKHQANAVKANEVGQKVIDNIGKNNESVRDILDSFRASSV